jgi:hypothetical protein
MTKDVIAPDQMGEGFMPESVNTLSQPIEEVGVIIDPDFKTLLPSKPQDQYEALKEAISIDRKIRNPLVVWKETSILLDGHNRHHISKELGIKPPIRRKSFSSREDAKMWVLKNQLKDRRNLNPFQRVELALKSKSIFLHYNII